ncbi:hypothetical protein CDEST_10460 [Colletotrichum destructivum]|uniref:Uncharacterized protein n=1 Tax=Colletotrichum destructivum TaxID=34406 RepID=A0AAX4IPJ3_9PEZI|nr:hypothetical protein CDEST_10460 [Colletotrichum destructivum]
MSAEPVDRSIASHFVISKAGRGPTCRDLVSLQPDKNSLNSVRLHANGPLATRIIEPMGRDSRTLYPGWPGNCPETQRPPVGRRLAAGEQSS